MGKFLKTDNRQTLEGIYEDYGSAFQRVPLMTKARSPGGPRCREKPERCHRPSRKIFYDNSFVQKIEASGFINSLYAR